MTTRPLIPVDAEDLLTVAIMVDHLLGTLDVHYRPGRNAEARFDQFLENLYRRVKQANG